MNYEDIIKERSLIKKQKQYKKAEYLFIVFTTMNRALLFLRREKGIIRI